MQIKYNDKLTEREKRAVNKFTSYLTKSQLKEPKIRKIKIKPVLDRTEVHIHDVMTPDEVCVFLNISKISLIRWTRKGKIKCIRINSRGDRRYLRSEINKLLGGTI